MAVADILNAVITKGVLRCPHCGETKLRMEGVHFYLPQNDGPKLLYKIDTGITSQDVTVDDIEECDNPPSCDLAFVLFCQNESCGPGDAGAAICLQVRFDDPRNFTWETELWD
jgi:hypothetical protein